MMKYFIFIINFLKNWDNFFHQELLVMKIFSITNNLINDVMFFIANNFWWENFFNMKIRKFFFIGGNY